jgi:predicted N-acyltransferase
MEGFMGYALKVFNSILEIVPGDWNSLTTPETVPFLDWEWLAALEESGSVSGKTGWYPLHLTLWEGKRLAAAAPLYLKGHSQGEFVYDYFWAEAAASLGRSWYPKLVGVIPATPAEGYRFLFAEGTDGRTATAALLKGAERFCRDRGIAGLHLLFADPLWGAILPGLGYTPWEHSHYLWENAGYADFEAYLSIFSKNQRKNIRREYRRPEEQGIDLRIIPGEEAEPELFRRMFELFTITNDKFIPWDARYVNRDFFSRLEHNFRRRVAFVEARRRAAEKGGDESPGEKGAGHEGGSSPPGELIALAMLIRKGDKIWGRYWGAYEEVRDLHFAACYYAPMDWAIREGIRFFDPGAGSPHKIRRGFRAAVDKSYHKLFDPVLERLFRANIGAVNHYEREALAAMNAELPFHRSPVPGENTPEGISSTGPA